MKNVTRKFAEISSNSRTNDLNSLNKTFKDLDNLNKILQKVLPHHLQNTCHIGAMDIDTETVVLFVSNQQSFHLIRNFSEMILNALIQSNFNFQKILIKVSAPRESSNKIYRGELNSRQKKNLLKLAEEIGKPEIIRNNIASPVENSDEISF